ncbi:transposase [Mesorhizobium sp. M1312]|uniref:transposase n=1 Tax=unclassified Mesorhizobium TaxID=325217 RepID=UPI003337FBA6
MRRQTRPFIVEVKQRRGYQKRDNSIWGDMDLSSAFAETTRQLEEMDTSNRKFVDSNIVTFNAERLDQAKVGHHMAETEHIEPLNAATKGAANIEAPETKKKSRPPRNTKTDLRSPAPKNGASSEANKGVGSVRLGRKMYSEEERVQKLSQIEKLLGGGATLKSAVKQAGTTEQTYYQWKKKAVVAAVAAPASDDLKDLLALEEENKRLKNLLAERLRAENAELKRRLGL